MKETIATIAAIVIFGGVIFAGGKFALEYRKAYEPQNRSLDRKVFEESPSYVMGKAQTLSRYKREYARAKDDAERTAIASEAVHEASTIDHNKLPADVRDWVEGLN